MKFLTVELHGSISVSVIETRDYKIELHRRYAKKTFAHSQLKSF